MTAVIEASFVDYVQALGRDWPGPYPWMADALAMGRVHWIGAQQGAVVHELDLPWFKIDSIGILPRAQGKGLGRNAMAALETLAAAKGAQAIALFTAQPQTHLVSFYSRLGYRVTEIRPPASGKDDIPRIHMTKPLIGAS